MRSGDTGSLPAVVGARALMVFFGLRPASFLTSQQHGATSSQQAAPTTIMAMGLVFVLLLGEIDLSAGVVGSTAAVLAAVLLGQHGMPWYIAVLGAAASGAVIGTVLGWLRAKLGIPSFVVTLAAFLAFQGVQVLVIDRRATASRSTTRSCTTSTSAGSPRPPGWAAADRRGRALRRGQVLQATPRRRKQPGQRAGRRARPAGGWRCWCSAASFVYVMNIDQAAAWQQREGIHQRGVPWSRCIILGLLVVLTFVLTKTRYGRHVFAVGGNEEAARRAGIRVWPIRTSVFVICSAMAAVSGLVLAGQLGRRRTPATAAATPCCYAVAAAVIGGTSLFGGRGRVVDAVLGGVVLAIIANGMSDLIQGGNAAAYELIIDGVVLLLAAAVDSLSRRAGADAAADRNGLITVPRPAAALRHSMCPEPGL